MNEMPSGVGPKRKSPVTFGIIAQGRVAVGVVAMGGVAIGVVAIGGIAIGGVALGAVALGAMALGAVALGWKTIGAVSVGLADSQNIWASAGLLALALGGVLTSGIPLRRRRRKSPKSLADGESRSEH